VLRNGRTARGWRGEMKSATLGLNLFSKAVPVGHGLSNIRDLPTVVGAMIDNVSYNGTNGATVF
jgi:hypothetical protein